MTAAAHAEGKVLPLHGIRVIEVTHLVMGPDCGLVPIAR